MKNILPGSELNLKLSQAEKNYHFIIAWDFFYYRPAPYTHKLRKRSLFNMGSLKIRLFPAKKYLAEKNENNY